MSQAEFFDLLRRYLAGTCSAAERQLVEGWYDSVEGSQAAAQLPAPERDALQARIWQRLAARHEGVLPAQLPARPEPAPVEQLAPAAPAWQRPALRWAAGVALALGSAGWWGWTHRAAPPTMLATITSTDAQGWTTHLNRTAGVLRVRLPDGSTAALSPAARLRFPARFAAGSRPVQLRGEAFFWVAKNPRAPFQVFTDQLVTTVLGTSFRVREAAAGRPAVVAVRTGRVAVAPRETAAAVRRQSVQKGRVEAPAQGVLVLPNQQAVYSTTTGQIQAELVDKPEMLVPRRFVFEERPVAEVLATLAEAYGVDIAYDAARLRGCTVHVTFHDEPLFEKLGILCKSLGAYYRVDHTRIVFRSNGCGAAAPSAGAGQ